MEERFSLDHIRGPAQNTIKRARGGDVSPVNLNLNVFLCGSAGGINSQGDVKLKSAQRMKYILYSLLFTAKLLLLATHIKAQCPGLLVASAGLKQVLTCANPSPTLEGYANYNTATFLWSGPGGFSSNLAKPKVKAPGTYTLTVTEPSTGCTVIASVQVQLDTVAPKVTVDALSGTVTCKDKVPLGWVGAPNDYQWNWTGPKVYVSQLGYPYAERAGTYMGTVTAPNGCTKTFVTAVLEDFAKPDAAIETVPLATGCGVRLEGKTSAKDVYRYWIDGTGNYISQNNLYPIQKGTYTFQVTNVGNGCSATATRAVADANTVFAYIEGALCLGQNSLLKTSGNGSFLWSTGLSKDSLKLTPSAFGTYTVTVTHANGCTATASASVSTMNATVDATPIGCAGGMGCLTASASGGTLPYVYTWSNGVTTGKNCYVSARPIRLWAWSADGCMDTMTVIVREPAPITIAYTVRYVKTGDPFADIVLNVMGGTPPFAFAWDGPKPISAGSDTLLGVPVGSYTITVTDQNNCSAVQKVTVKSGVHALVETLGACNGVKGNITVNLLSGVAPFNYVGKGAASFSGSSNDPVFSIPDLPPGQYELTLTDVGGSSQTLHVEVGNIVGASLAVFMGCYGTANLDVKITPTQGMNAFDWAHLPGATNAPTLYNQPTGATYTVTVTNSAGCTQTLEAQLPLTKTFNPNITQTAPSCFGQSNGKIQVAPSGGLAPYRYNWSDGSTEQNRYNLSAGTYTVTISDAGNCTCDYTMVLNQFQTTNLALTVEAVSCYGKSDGSIYTSGGTFGTYSWSIGKSTSSIIGIPAGTYTLTYQDAFGCPSIYKVVVPQPPNLTVNMGVCDYTATANGLGGTPPYQYLWSNGNTTAMALLPFGSHRVTVTDAKGCAKSAQVQVPSTKPCKSESDVSQQRKGEVYRLQVAPNPVNSIANIWLEGAPKTGDYNLRLYDLRGALLLELTSTVPRFELSCEYLATGLYWFEMRHEGGPIGIGKMIREE